MLVSSACTLGVWDWKVLVRVAVVCGSHGVFTLRLPPASHSALTETVKHFSRPEDKVIPRKELTGLRRLLRSHMRRAFSYGLLENQERPHRCALPSCCGSPRPSAGMLFTCPYCDTQPHTPLSYPQCPFLCPGLGVSWESHPISV